MNHGPRALRMAALAGVMPNRSVSVSIETSGLSSRYIATVLLLAAQAMFEYFDFYVVGYLVAVLAPTWRLSYGQVLDHSSQRRGRLDRRRACLRLGGGSDRDAGCRSCSVAFSIRLPRA